MSMIGKSVGVVKKSSGEVASTEWANTITLDGISAVKMPFGPMDVQSYASDGFNLIINLNSGATITIEKFFAKFSGESGRSEIILEDAEGISWSGQFDPAISEFTFTEILAVDSNTSVAAADALGTIPDWALIGLSVLAVGGVAIAGSSGGGGSSSSSNNVPVEPVSSNNIPAGPVSSNDSQAEVSADDLFNVAISTAANDNYNLGDGAGRVVFENLSLDELGGNGGNGIDSWIEFSEADGDIIDISALLDGNQTADNLSQYLEYKEGKLRVDRKGEADFEDLLVIDAESLAELMPSIIWQAPALPKSYFEPVEFSIFDTDAGLDLSSLDESAELNLFDTESAEIELALEEILSPETDNEQFRFFAEGDVEVAQASTVDIKDGEIALNVTPTVDFLDDLLSQSHLEV